MAKREIWLDAAKGVGILFVVAAHTAGEGAGSWNASFTNAVFLFHMPLFLVISGYVFKPTERGEFFWKKVASLAVPYVVFLAVLTAAVIFKRVLLGSTPAPWELRQMVTNDILGGMYLTKDFGVFWFVTCLFFTQVIYNEVAFWAKGPLTPRMISFVAASTALAYIIQDRWPLNFSPLAIAAVPFALTCYWFGNLVRERNFGPAATALFLGAVAIAAVVGVNSGTDIQLNMKSSIFGPPLLGLVIALAIASGLLLLVRSLQSSRIITQPLAMLGEASLVIMFLHQFFHFSLREMGIENEPLIVLVAVLVPFAIYMLLRRSPALAPWFLGSRGGLPSRLLDRLRHAIEWRAARYLPNAFETIARYVALLKITVRWATRRKGQPSGLNEELIVSLTSYPPRFETLALTLKCLLSQTVQADRTILWVAAKDHALLPDDVLSLTSDGLEIRLCKDIRSYKKIYPALIEFPGASIVTADDDVYYAATWLAELVAHAGEKTVVCHRAHSITVDESGLIKPYRNWTMDVPGDDDMLFPTGVGGVLYTPGSLASEVVDEAEFQRLCPNADDVWLFWMGRRAGSTYRKASAKWRVIPWKGTQDSALYLANVEGSGNDAQIANMLLHFGPPEKKERQPTAPLRQPEPQELSAKATVG